MLLKDFAFAASSLRRSAGFLLTANATIAGAGKWMRSFVVVTKVPLSFVLLVGSGLMVRTFIALHRIDPGFDPRGVLTFRLPLTTARSPQQSVAMSNDLRQRFAALPGVTAASATSTVPLDGVIPLARWGTEGYGALSDAVRQRTAEIGLGMALGAAPEGIFRLMVGQGLRLSGAGIVEGAIAAVALTRVMASMLVGVEAHDPATFSAIAVLFFLIAAVACWLPARRAAGLDPTTALREE